MLRLRAGRVATMAALGACFADRVGKKFFRSVIRRSHCENFRQFEVAAEFLGKWIVPSGRREQP